ncbi:MAG: hypothetical protein UY52_C0004G0013 [Parcubacteria group bacterium GW2011_GWC2_49_9]|nr:MAG: hypothetical protein UY34_C0030G0012 [Parcubacteria group bacterium GW2011_GWA2_48_9]KKW16449.1 MAG: hypothetical protein UY52_C0004G0013 [Parcubacteria group bacterium GW2011_GWC2_49_9]
MNEEARVTLTLSKKAQMLRPGIYEHYKGKRYKVIGVVRHSETLEELVHYQALYGEYGFWVRPLIMFIENITIDGTSVPRFKYLREK